MLGRKPQPERDEHRSGHALERAADPPAAEEVAGPRDGYRVAGEPRERHGAEEKSEEKQPQEGGPAELGQQTGEEDGHFRIAKIADQPLAECPRPGQASAGRRHHWPVAPMENCDQRLGPEEDQISRAGEP